MDRLRFLRALTIRHLSFGVVALGMMGFIFLSGVGQAKADTDITPHASMLGPAPLYAGFGASPASGTPPTTKYATSVGPNNLGKYTSGLSSVTVIDSSDLLQQGCDGTSSCVYSETTSSVVYKGGSQACLTGSGYYEAYLAKNPGVFSAPPTGSAASFGGLGTSYTALGFTYTPTTYYFCNAAGSSSIQVTQTESQHHIVWCRVGNNVGPYCGYTLTLGVNVYTATFNYKAGGTIPSPSIASLSASPNPVAYDTTTSLSWSSSNASYVSITGPGFSAATKYPASSTGTPTPVLKAQATYSLKACDPIGTCSAPKSLTVNVLPSIFAELACTKVGATCSSPANPLATNYNSTAYVYLGAYNVQHGYIETMNAGDTAVQAKTSILYPDANGYLGTTFPLQRTTDFRLIACADSTESFCTTYNYVRVNVKPAPSPTPSPKPTATPTPIITAPAAVTRFCTGE